MLHVCINNLPGVKVALKSKMNTPLLTQNQIIELLCTLAVDCVVHKKVRYSCQMTHVTRSATTTDWSAQKQILLSAECHDKTTNSIILHYCHAFHQWSYCMEEKHHCMCSLQFTHNCLSAVLTLYNHASLCCYTRPQQFTFWTNCFVLH